jgi:hypothetical protein
MVDIFQKSFDNITGADIKNLIYIKYEERQRMEYKREMYGNKDEDKRKMLRDISSFANAYGGYLIIGIEHENGIPREIIDIDNAEMERDRIEKSCLANIEPRISDLKCRTIQMDSGENEAEFNPRPKKNFLYFISPPELFFRLICPIYHKATFDILLGPF